MKDLVTHSWEASWEVTPRLTLAGLQGREVGCQEQHKAGGQAQPPQGLQNDQGTWGVWGVAQVLKESSAEIGRARPPRGFVKPELGL